MAHEATDLRKGRPSVSLFSVQNVSARGLTRKTLFGTSEPFVRLLVLPDQDNVCSGYEKIQSIEQFAATTPTASSSSSPNWSDKFWVKVDDANCWLFAEVLDHSKLVAGKSLIQSSYGYCAYHVNFLKSVGSEARSYESQLVARRGSKTKAKGSISISVKKIEPDAFQREDMECNKVFRCDPEVNAEEGWIESRLDSEELPSGWEGRKDQNGRVYYLNHATRTTQWNKPSFSDSSAKNHISSRSSGGGERQIRAARTQVCEETGDGGLENGELSSIDQKVNDDASWINERERNANVNRELNVKTENEGAGGGGDDLPPGWEMRAAKNGRVYFVDHVNEITTWVDPRLGVRSREGNSSAANAQLVLDMLMGTRGGVVAGNIALSDSNSTSGSDAGVSHPVKVLPAGWEERATKDGRVFYVDHNTQTTSWQDPRLLMEGPAVQFNPNYKSKYKAFKAKLRKAPSSSAHCVIRVTRANLLETSFDSICRIVKDDPSRLRCKLWVEYAGEQGLDYGGMSREWFQDVSCQMLDPYYGLFEYSAADSSYSLQINPLSALCCGRDHLKYFSFVGTVCAMAIYHGKLIDGYFVKSFYKTLLGKEVVLEDLESVDIRYYQSMKMLLECGEEELAEIEADFTLSEHQLEGGRAPARTVSLLPNGNEIPVTIHNREQFVQLVLQYKLVEQVQSQMEAFLSGFSVVVDPSLLKLFDETELELLMAGLPQVNVKDWKDHTLYKRGYSEEHEVIQWFWRVVLDYSDEERCRLLKFVTGTSHLPLHGFSQLQGSDGPQMFTIQRSDTQTTTAQHLPKAHTCFNLLDLPRYRSYSEMKSKLTMAINHSSEFAIS